MSLSVAVCPARALSVVFVAAVLSACSPSKPAAEADVRPVLVMTVGGSEQSLANVRRVPGVVAARYSSDIAFQAAGRIAKRSVELGARVRKGQPLMQLDNRDYRLALAAADDQVMVAKTQFQQADADAKRLVTLVAAGAISVADSERQTARANAAKAQFQQAKRQADLARNRLRYANLVAPYDGVITGLYAEAGQVVSEGVPVMSMAQPGELEIVADIPERLINEVSKQRAEAVVSGTDAARLPLTLREISPAASQTLRTYRARYAFAELSDAQRQALHLGMTADVMLSTNSVATEAVVLPATALVKTRDRSSVWLVNGAALRLQPVAVQRYENTRVVVTGVAQGAQVVIAGVQKLDAKMTVRAVERSGSGVVISTAGARP